MLFLPNSLDRAIGEDFVCTFPLILGSLLSVEGLERTRKDALEITEKKKLPAHSFFRRVGGSLKAHCPITRTRIEMGRRRKREGRWRESSASFIPLLAPLGGQGKGRK